MKTITAASILGICGGRALGVPGGGGGQAV